MMLVGGTYQLSVTVAAVPASVSVTTVRPETATRGRQGSG